MVAILEKKSAFTQFVETFQIEEDYRMIGRDHSSFATFPETWQRTESITNDVASQIFGFKDLDITAGCCALGPTAAAILLKVSTERLTDTEWPVICLKDKLAVTYTPVAFIIYDQTFNAGRNDDNWRSYLPRLQLALRGVTSLSQVEPQSHFPGNV